METVAGSECDLHLKNEFNIVLILKEICPQRERLLLRIILYCVLCCIKISRQATASACFAKHLVTKVILEASSTVKHKCEVNADQFARIPARVATILFVKLFRRANPR